MEKESIRFRLSNCGTSMQNVPCFRSQEAKHQNEEMKKKKEQEERKAQVMAEVKLWFI